MLVIVCIVWGVLYVFVWLVDYCGFVFEEFFIVKEVNGLWVVNICVVNEILELCCEDLLLSFGVMVDLWFV